jgi:hypothetical protein
MNILKIGAAVSVGFALSVVLFHTSVVKAQGSNQVHVFIYPVEMFSTKSTTSKDLPGLRIAGISCIPKPETKLPDAAVCYVATTLN